MIIVKLMGGLGNQMFQYALGKALSLERGEDVIYDTSFYNNNAFFADEQKKGIYRRLALHHFNVNLKEEIVLSHFKRYLRVGINEVHKRFPQISKITSYSVFYEASDYTYHSEIQNHKSKWTYLEGYWQSEKYFVKHRNEILHDFQIITPQNDTNKMWGEMIKCCNSVSLHVRRGDYLSLGWCLDVEYYLHAIEYMSKHVKNPVFFIFSDDIQWVKDNLNLPDDVHYMTQNSQEDAYEDMRLMSLCKHNIIANSSFSWWAAWLNQNEDKIVVAPNKWLAGFRSQDIIPEKWAII